MTADHTFKVRQRTITNLQIITVEQFMKLMRFWEMLTQQAEECFANIYRNIKTKWWVKPYNHFSWNLLLWMFFAVFEV